MKIVVFGKNGQLSKAIQKRIDVQSISKKEVNFLKKNEIKKFFYKKNFDLIINTSSFNNIEKAEQNTSNAFKINSNGPMDLSNIAKKNNIPLIHFSSDYVFDGTGSNKWKTNNKTAPISEYGKSKKLGELNIIKSNCKFIIIRTSWLFSSNNNNFVSKIIKLSKKNNEFSVVGDQIGGPTCVDDLADFCKVIVKKIQLGSIKYGIYHFSGLPYVSRYNFAKYILNKTNSSTKIIKINSKSSQNYNLRPKNSKLNCKKTIRIFNVKLPSWKKSLDLILKKYEKK